MIQFHLGNFAYKFSSHEQFETQYNTQIQQQGCNLDASYWLKPVIVWHNTAVQGIAYLSCNLLK